MNSEQPSTETVSDARLQDLINLYDGQAFRGDTVLALEELQRLRHYVATCGGTDNDGRCPMHHLAGLRSSGGASETLPADLRETYDFAMEIPGLPGERIRKLVRDYNRLRQSPPEPSGGQWQPIETAPHMRKIIVHYLNPAGKHRTVMACYYEKNSLEMHDDYAEVGTYDAEKDGYFADEGWYEEHDSDDPIMKLQGEPDHWMPLPTPPLTKSG